VITVFGKCIAEGGGHGGGGRDVPQDGQEGMVLQVENGRC